jgi:hypothetical protein
MNDNSWSAGCYNGELVVLGGGDGTDQGGEKCNEYVTDNAPSNPYSNSNCYECYKNNSRENYVQSPQAPWNRPGSYLNMNQTWGGQKPFQL